MLVLSVVSTQPFCPPVHCLILVPVLGELAMNSILGPWYQQSLGWNQTKSGQVAAAFGLFNVISRPMGGVIADWLYAAVPANRGTKTKQIWYGFVSFPGMIVCLALTEERSSWSPLKVSCSFGPVYWIHANRWS
jgi:nitrate/nitrite transporter NarK